MILREDRDPEAPGMHQSLDRKQVVHVDDIELMSGRGAGEVGPNHPSAEGRRSSRHDVQPHPRRELDLTARTVEEEVHLMPLPRLRASMSDRHVAMREPLVALELTGVPRDRYDDPQPELHRLTASNRPRQA